MEKIINKKINDYMTEYDIITPFQSGFRHGDSTTNQLLFLSNEMYKAFDENKEIRIVFCDISKAFDRMWHKGLLFKLRSIGFSEHIVAWFEDYLHKRQQRVCIKGVSSTWKFVTAGVPQGSILGPTLFLIYINDIVRELDSNIRLFADDTSLYIVVENPANAALHLNADLLKIFNWALVWLVDFHPDKTVSFIASRKRLKPDHPPLFMGNTQIKEVKKHKHLGLIISSDGNWTPHISYICEKAWKRIGSLRKNKFLLDKLSLLKLYTTYIRPLLEYANIIWDNCSDENRKQLENINKEAARIITGGTKLCSIQKLYDDTGLQTLQTRRNQAKITHLYKIINGLAPQYLRNLIPQTVQTTSRYPLRNMNNLILPAASTEYYTKSYFPSTIREWNTMDLTVRKSPSLNAFKLQININVPNYPKYYDVIHTSRMGQVYHNRLRLECSSLRHHLFKKKIVADSLCSCGAVETTSHYLLNCEHYRNLRIRYLYMIPPPLSIQKLLCGIQEATFEENSFIFKQVQLYILGTKRFETGIT